MKHLSKTASGSLALLCSLLFLGNSSAEAQRKKPTPPTRRISTAPKKPAPPPAEIVAQRPAFDPSGLKMHNLFGYVYDGRFERLSTSDFKFNVALISFVRSFSNNCQRFLPKDRVEITYLSESYDTQVTTLLNRRGQIVGSYSTPIVTDRKIVGTGMYAEPRFATSFNAANTRMGLIFSQQFIGALLNRQTANFDDFIKATLDSRDDSSAFLNRYGCNSVATRHFAENLWRAANSQASIQAQNGEDSFFIKECRQKLPGISRAAGPNSCKCLSSEFQSNLDTPLLLELEDSFDLEKFLAISFSKSGMHGKVSACLR